MLTPGAGIDYNPRTRLIYAENSIARLGELIKEYGGRRVLLVTDGGIVKAGHAARAEESITKAGLFVTHFDKVQENPTTRNVADCLEVARRGDVDFLVGLGGGSSLDTAKGTNFILTNGGKMADYWGVNKAAKAMLPLIAIPTTAGTGSECQCFALIADEVTHQKMACGDDKAYARAAILDPTLTLSLPLQVTANTGIDTVAHAVETYVTTVRNPLSQMFAKEAWRLAECNLEKVLKQPQNLEARGNMLLASAYGGMAIAQSMLGAAHAAANPLTAHYHVIHGQAVGVMLPPVIRFNSGNPASAKQYADLAAAAGLSRSRDDADSGVNALLRRLNELLQGAGILDAVKAQRIPSDKLDVLSAEAAKQWTASFNPRPIAAPDFKGLYESALRG